MGIDIFLRLDILFFCWWRFILSREWILVSCLLFTQIIMTLQSVLVLFRYCKVLALPLFADQS